MNNLDWGKTTSERNANLDKYHSLNTEVEKQEFLNELKTRKYLEGRAELLKYSIKITTTLGNKITLEQELESILEKLKK